LLAAFTERYHAAASLVNSDLHALTMKEVLRILVDNGATLPTVFGEYFRTIGVWLPIVVSERALYKQLQAKPSSELALLVLSMFLAVQVPNRHNDGKPFPQTPIYFAAKSLHSALIGAGALSLEIAQASVLIVLYEVGQGMVDQARISAAFCSRIGMRLASMRRYQQTSMEDDADLEKLWWSIMMLDR
jgi:hypothetical protein